MHNPQPLKFITAVLELKVTADNEGWLIGMLEPWIGKKLKDKDYNSFIKRKKDEIPDPMKK